MGPLRGGRPLDVVGRYYRRGGRPFPGQPMPFRAAVLPRVRMVTAVQRVLFQVEPDLFEVPSSCIAANATRGANIRGRPMFPAAYALK